MEDINKRRRISFSLSKPECAPQESTPGKFAKICHFQQIRIYATKFGKTGIHFIRDVFAVVPLVDAKAPYSPLWLHIYEFHVIYILKRTTSTIQSFFSRKAIKTRGHCAHFITKGDE